ncbi:hypothetical protein EDEG_00101 [Edhazardia aedis USNM 41457]|uniref:SUN domain-containing protein n=1 Tax=Edhazardia aedis (strain USNM 41457) TaxID=1003232 RepID=J9DAU0_EDHAE|nr:hypothetical protein EDEG_00101 [Edhazardia aedis USNM 41457]|eukprot:EJW04881.1 hypothetical protein EDEG_00101 [Edhazardia aedis USNM 41457]
MERRRTSRIIRTPNKTICPSEGDTIVVDSPMKRVKNLFTKLSENKETQNNGINKLPSEEVKANGSPFFQIDYKLFISFLTNIIIILFFTARQAPEIDKKSFLDLQNQTNQLKAEIQYIVNDNKALKLAFENKLSTEKNKIVPIIKDYASIEEGAYLDRQNTSQPYKHGIFRTKVAYDANILLSGRVLPGECFAFDGTSGYITIMFDREIFVNFLRIIHCDCTDKTSALKNFTIYGIREIDTNGVPKIGEQNILISTINGKIRKYELIKLRDDIFDIKKSHKSDYTVNMGDFVGFKIFIHTNSGNIKYTTIYKIAVYGNEV